MIPCMQGIISWPFRASSSKSSLAGPIGPAIYLLLEDLENVAENMAEVAKYVSCLGFSTVIDTCDKGLIAEK